MTRYSYHCFWNRHNLVSLERNEQFSNIKQTPVQRLISYHVPIALRCGFWEQSKSYFKFENGWLITKGLSIESEVDGAPLSSLGGLITY